MQLKKNTENFKINWLQPIEECEINVSKYFNPNKCSACNTSITISPNGDIRPCSFSNAKAGNIKKESILKVWNSEFFKDFREGKIMKEKCKKCENREKCNGGCNLELLKNIKENAL